MNIHARRSRLFAVAGLATTLLCGWVSPKAHAEFLIKPNQRVVFFGDSITEGRNYTRPIQEYVYARYPQYHVKFYNAGWGGDSAGRALSRMERDVLPLKPDLVMVCLGMNDGRYTKINDDILNTYRRDLEGIVKGLTDRGIRVVVFTPSCVDYDKRPALRDADYNGNLETLGAAAIEIAKKYGCASYDILHPMLKAQAALKATNPNFTMIPDAIHPDETGGLVMAGYMLQGLGAEPMRPLASLSSTQIVDTKTGVKAADVKSADSDLTFAATTSPVPVPVWMGNGTDVLRTAGLLPLYGQLLQVRGLAPGSYDVSINGSIAGRWNNTELGAGVPVMGNSPRARRIYDLVNWKEQNYFNAWRNLKLAESGPAIDTAFAALMKADDSYQTAIEALGTAPIAIGVRNNGLPADLGLNLALRRPYVSSDPNVFNFGYNALTDGSWEASGEHTFASGDKDTFPKTATIDLEAARSVAYVLLGVPPFGSTKTITISTSEDGQTFTEAGTYVFSQNKEERHLFAFPGRFARYVRLTFPDHYPNEVGYTPTFSFASEVEIYGATRF